MGTLVWVGLVYFYGLVGFVLFRSIRFFVWWVSGSVGWLVGLVWFGLVCFLLKINPCHFPRISSPFSFFTLFWGPLCFPLTRQKRYLFAGGPNSSLGQRVQQILASTLHYVHCTIPAPDFWHRWQSELTEVL